MVLKHQESNNDRNSENISKTTLISTYDNNNNNNNNIHVFNDARIVKHDIETFVKNQDHPRNASSLKRNNNVALMILFKISGDYKIK